MSKLAWRMAWIGAALVVGCGSQAVEFPASSDGPVRSPEVLACTTASQCSSGQGCVSGSCAACTDAAQCSPGQFCGNGVCGACTSNSQCTGGKACVNGACGGCTNGDQCTDGLACVLGSCGACTGNDQCTTGKICLDGKCACSSDAQCPSGQECKVGVCKEKPTGSDAGADADSGDAGLVDSGFDAADACAGKPIVQNIFPNVPSAWALNGKVGTAAGDEMCKSVGADHFCDYAEIRAAQARGAAEAAFAALPNMTFWVHRTTPETVGGVVNSGGAGARCGDWTYSTNHLQNGEFGTIGGVAGAHTYTYDLAPADKLTPGTAGSAGSARLCGGQNRNILCCYAKCP